MDGNSLIWSALLAAPPAGARSDSSDDITLPFEIKADDYP